MTEYVILSKDSGERFWTEQARRAASSADAAIRGWAESSKTEGLAVVAVPARSWQPRVIQVKTQTRISLADPPAEKAAE